MRVGPTLSPQVVPPCSVIRRLTGQGLSIFGKALNGLMVGMLYDFVVELLFDPTGKKLREAYRAGARAGADAVAHAAQAALATVARDLGEDKLLLDELGRAITRAGSRGALFGLVEWMKLERAALSIPVVDDSLYRGLIEAWVLQRAGDEEDGNKHTDPEAYAAAHDKLAPDGNLARRDLFIHQCRFAFARLGLDTDRQLMVWEDAIRADPGVSEDELIQRLGPLHFEVERFADPTRFVDTMAEMGGPFDLEMPLIADAASTRERLRAEGGPVEAMLGPVADYTTAVEDCVRSGGVRLRCAVELTSADGAVFVDTFRYRMWGARHKADGEPLDPGMPWIAPRAWTDSPD